MVDVAPFRGLRYDVTVAGDPATTSAPAYDEVGRFAYAQHRTASPYTILELIAGRGEGGYRAAGAAYDRWRRTGVLIADPPSYYLYEEHELRHGVPALQRGLLAAVALHGSEGARVLAHEQVDPLRVRDRVERLRAVPADLSPVFGLYDRGPASLRALLERRPRTPPAVATTDEAGIDHRVWALTDPADHATIQAGLAGLSVVIADGHHRFAAAAALYAQRRSGRQVRDPPWGRTLMYLVDASEHGPQLWAVHRLARRLPADVLRRLSEDFWIDEVGGDLGVLQAVLARAQAQALGLRLPGGAGFLARARDKDALRERMPAGHSPTWYALDAAVVDHVVLPRLGLDVRGPEVDHTAEVAWAVARVDAGEAAGLLLCRPPTVDTVARLAAAGEYMPAKTTSFRPKPRAGLVLRPLDE